STRMVRHLSARTSRKFSKPARNQKRKREEGHEQTPFRNVCVACAGRCVGAAGAVSPGPAAGHYLPHRHGYQRRVFPDRRPRKLQSSAAALESRLQPGAPGKVRRRGSEPSSSLWLKSASNCFNKVLYVGEPSL